MPRDFKAISSAQFIDLCNKQSFEFDDVHLASCYIAKPLERKFETPLTHDEKLIVKKLVCQNLNKLFLLYIPLFQDPTKNDYLIDKDYLKLIKSICGENLASNCHYKVYYFLSEGSLKDCVFEGKIPKKGFFSNRQDLANKWLSEFVKHFGMIAENVLLKTNSDKTMGLYAIGCNISCFLIETYPEDFDTSMSFDQIFAKIPRL